MSNEQASRIVPSYQKFFLLSLVTFGVYPTYWGWKTWEIVKRARGAKHHTSVRGFFLFFTCINLFKEIAALAKEAGYKETPDATRLGIGFVATTLIANRVTNSPNVSLAASAAIGVAAAAIITAVVNPISNATKYYLTHADKPAGTFDIKTNWSLILLLVAIWTVFIALLGISGYYANTPNI